MCLFCTPYEIYRVICRKWLIFTYHNHIWRPGLGWPWLIFIKIFGINKVESLDYSVTLVWFYVYLHYESVLWRCWLGGRKGIRPVKNWVVGYWRGYLSGARCRLACGPADATATHCLLLHLNPDWFCLLVPAHPGSPGQRAVKRVCVTLWVKKQDTKLLPITSSNINRFLNFFSLTDSVVNLQQTCV